MSNSCAHSLKDVSWLQVTNEGEEEQACVAGVNSSLLQQLMLAAGAQQVWPWLEMSIWETPEIVSQDSIFSHGLVWTGHDDFGWGACRPAGTSLKHMSQAVIHMTGVSGSTQMQMRAQPQQQWQSV